MKIGFFDTHAFERPFFDKANDEAQHEITYLEPRLTLETVTLAKGFDAVCIFVNDKISAEVITALKEYGIKIIALRSAGFNNVNLESAALNNIKVARVPEYSPYAVAEHAVGLILSLNRKIHRAYSRIQERNFSLNGLVGFDLHGKTVGVVGTGKIGSIFANIMKGFGCKILAYDINPDPQIARYVELQELFKQSDIISLHIPLTPSTHHLINDQAINQMKEGVMLVNTGRGALLDTKSVIKGLKSGKIGYAALDVYEEEEGIFFHDLSDTVIQDDTLVRLLTFPNVLLTSHQGFLTKEALKNIADTTISNLSQFESREKLVNEVCAKVHVKKN